MIDNVRDEIAKLLGGETREDFIYIKRYGLWLYFVKHSKYNIYLGTTRNRYNEPFVFTKKTRTRIFNLLYTLVDERSNVLVSFDDDSEQELFSLFVANKKLLG
jgi:hypothetical protein